MWGGMTPGRVFGEGAYEIVSGAPIGKGSGGTVYRGKAVATELPVAVKVIERMDVDCDPQKVRQLERELNITIKLRHQVSHLPPTTPTHPLPARSHSLRLLRCLPGARAADACHCAAVGLAQNIVNLIDVKFEDEVVLLVSELVDGGPLYDRVSAGPIPEEEARFYFQQMVEAIAYCHQQKVIHRDLKLENVLVSRTGELKIADFGVSKDTSVSSMPKTRVGTISYMAPEVTMVSKVGSGVDAYGGPADIWSLAVILYVLTCGQYPFGFDGPKRQGGMPTSRVYERIRSGTVEYPEQLSPEIVELLQGMFIVDAAQRWGFDEIRECAWYCGGKFEAADLDLEGSLVGAGGGASVSLAELLGASAEQTIRWPEPSPGSLLAAAKEKQSAGLSMSGGVTGLSPPSLRDAYMFSPSSFNDSDDGPSSFGSDGGMGVFSPVGSLGGGDMPPSIGQAGGGGGSGSEPPSPSRGGRRRNRFDSMGSDAGVECMVFDADSGGLVGGMQMSFDGHDGQQFIMDDDPVPLPVSPMAAGGRAPGL